MEDEILKQIKEIKETFEKIFALFTDSVGEGRLTCGWQDNIKLYSDWLKEQKISKRTFCAAIGKTEGDIGQVLAGKRRLSRPTKALFELFKENYEFKQVFNK